MFILFSIYEFLAALKFLIKVYYISLVAFRNVSGDLSSFKQHIFRKQHTFQNNLKYTNLNQELGNYITMTHPINFKVVFKIVRCNK